MAITLTGKFTQTGKLSFAPPPVFIGDIGVFAGGRDSGNFVTNIINYITISSLGASGNFGELLTAKASQGGTSNGASDRGVFAGGVPSTNLIQYVTMSTPSNSTDFGELRLARWASASVSNGTSDRGVFISGGGNTKIDYITISTASDAVDFGVHSTADSQLTGTSNGTNDRGLFGGGVFAGDAMGYITITSLGNSVAWSGTLSSVRNYLSAVSNDTTDRAVFGGGTVYTDVMEYVTISVDASADDFGNLSIGIAQLGGVSNGINDRGVFAGGKTGSTTWINIIQYITITSLGNSADFGDLPGGLSQPGSTENSFG